MANPVQWFEIAAVDLERAKIFYSTVFGLEFQYVEIQETKMYMFGQGDQIGSGGCLVESPGNQPSANGTIIYFSCDNIENEEGLIVGAGGQLIIPKTDIGEFGFFAQLIDTEGNRIGLHSAK